MCIRVVIVLLQFFISLHTFNTYDNPNTTDYYMIRNSYIILNTILNINYFIYGFVTLFDKEEPKIKKSKLLTILIEQQINHITDKTPNKVPRILELLS